MENEHKPNELANLRAKKFYEKNKAIINENRRLKRLEKKNGEPLVNQSLIPTDADTKTTNDILLEKLNSLDLKLHTKKKYLGDFKRLTTITDNEPIVKLIKNAETLIDKIKNCDYANNTKKGIIQVVLYMITQFNIKVNKNALNAMTQYFELTKENSSKEVEEKKENIVIPTWSEYLEQVKTEFGDTSKMYLIARLYSELSLRDDFVLKIVNKSPKTTDDNYLVLNKSNYKIIINHYKTEKKYGKIQVKLTKSLTNLIKTYMEANGLGENDYLLGDKELSGFITYNNKKLGINGGVSLYRQMSITQELNKKMTDEQRIALAEKMKHSVFIQKNYLRQMKKMDKVDAENVVDENIVI
jgi:hypothetical protein